MTFLTTSEVSLISVARDGTLGGTLVFDPPPTTSKNQSPGRKVVVTESTQTALNILPGSSAKDLERFEARGSKITKLRFSRFLKNVTVLAYISTNK